MENVNSLIVSIVFAFLTYCAFKMFNDLFLIAFVGGAFSYYLLDKLYR